MGPDVIPAQKVISHLPTFRWHSEKIRMKNWARWTQQWPIKRWRLRCIIKHRSSKVLLRMPGSKHYANETPPLTATWQDGCHSNTNTKRTCGILIHCSALLAGSGPMGQKEKQTSILVSNWTTFGHYVIWTRPEH